MKITLIITYKNEKKEVLNTLTKIFNQTLLPNEILFINSSSTDRSFDFLTNKIKKLSKEKKKIIKNIQLNTKFPSDSKNLGIQIAKNELIAIMDCGLNFSNSWLKDSLNLIKKKNADAVLAKCQLIGKNQFDKACVAQTYGIGRLHNCIPGSLIKKKIFFQLGYFSESRSFYDVIWKNKLIKSSFKVIYDNKVTVKYNKYNYSNSYTHLFIKSIEYYSSKENFLKNKNVFIYFILTFYFFFIFFKSFKLLLISILIYFTLRYLIALKKSDIQNYNIKFLCHLPFVGLTIDVARSVSLFKGFNSLIGIRGLVANLFFLLFLIFYTPLIDFFGNNLINIKNIDKKNYDAIIIFSGDGKMGYENSTYRNRALDAINYYELGIAKKLILSSGKENNKIDIQFIKLFLISKGVNSEDIHIFTEIPSSTYLNIGMVGKYLISKNYKNNIFITSPYHYLRSNLIWKKNFKDLNIVSVKTIDTIISYQWKQSFRKIFIIFYEYFAIIYNWFLGRL